MPVPELVQAYDKQTTRVRAAARMAPKDVEAAIREAAKHREHAAALLDGHAEELELVLAAIQRFEDALWSHIED
jgi:hypothetical protein